MGHSLTRGQENQSSQQDTDLQGQLIASNEQVTELQRQLTASNEQVTDLLRQLTASNQVVTDLQGQLIASIEQLTYLQLTASNQEDTDLQGQLIASNQEVTDLQGQLIASIEQLTDLQRQLTASNQEVTDLQGLLTESDQQFTDFQHQLIGREQQVTDLGRKLTTSNEQVTDLQRQLTASGQQRFADFQQQLSRRDRRLTALQRQVAARNQQITATPGGTHSSENRSEIQRDWEINRNEIMVTSDVLGQGAWGTVFRGKFRRCNVAVKKIYEAILSPHNRTAFEREVGIASRCRHPCLLQFIGATNDEEGLLLVTELMDRSLRSLYEESPLTEREISVISLDVAQALNYLHQNKPDPIIHRDVSSTNVLLWRQGDDWRGKVSDYGTANFVRQCRTDDPGAAIYCAPETLSGAENQIISCKVSLGKAVALKMG